MSSPDIVVRIDRKALYLLATLIAVAALGRWVWSETLTLTTTYPAPSGIYNTHTTTGNSYASPANTTFNLKAGNTILVPPPNTTGRVGIGTTNPGSKLDVNGDVNVGANLTVSGGARVGGWLKPPVGGIGGPCLLGQIAINNVGGSLTPQWCNGTWKNL